MSGSEKEAGSLAALGGFEAQEISDVFRRHADWLHRLLMRRLRAQPADADDIVQETYLRAARRPSTEIAHPKAYLAQTALNLFRDRERREAVRADHRRRVEMQPSQDQTPPSGLLEQEAAFELNRLITDMPQIYRDVFALSRFGRMTNRDIAAHLGISVKTVEWRMGKALEFCMSRLEG